MYHFRGDEPEVEVDLVDLTGDGPHDRRRKHDEEVRPTLEDVQQRVHDELLHGLEEEPPLLL